VLKENARTTVVDRLQAVEVRDAAGTRQVTDDIVELSDTGETFRRVTVEDTDGEVTAYLTTLDPTECAPIDVVSIYTLRWLIEIPVPRAEAVPQRPAVRQLDAERRAVRAVLYVDCLPAGAVVPPPASAPRWRPGSHPIAAGQLESGPPRVRLRTRSRDRGSGGE
jgi:hypothetical protein